MAWAFHDLHWSLTELQTPFIGTDRCGQVPLADTKVTRGIEDEDDDNWIKWHVILLELGL